MAVATNETTESQSFSLWKVGIASSFALGLVLLVTAGVVLISVDTAKHQVVASDGVLMSRGAAPHPVGTAKAFDLVNLKKVTQEQLIGVETIVVPRRGVEHVLTVSGFSTYGPKEYRLYFENNPVVEYLHVSESGVQIAAHGTEIEGQRLDRVSDFWVKVQVLRQLASDLNNDH